MKSALILLVVIAISSLSSATLFDVNVNEQRCVGEDLPKDTLLRGEFSIFPGYEMEMEVKVTSPEHLVLYSRENAAEGKFAFTSATAGNHMICFTNRVAPGRVVQGEAKRRVKLDVKTGVEAKDYSAVAKKEHLSKLDVELLKMQDTVAEIHHEFLYMRAREATMRNTNESSNSRVMWFSLFSILVLVASGLWQVQYLKAFFKKKKFL